MDTSKPEILALTQEWQYAFSLPVQPEDDSMKTIGDVSLRTLEEMLAWYCAGGKKQASRAVRGYVFCIFYNLVRRERIRRALPPPATP